MAANKVMYKGKEYQEVVVPRDATSEDSCNNCAFYDGTGCNAFSLRCIPSLRLDNLNVYYVEVKEASNAQ